MTTWPIYYPDRAAVPHDPTPETDGNKIKRSVRKLAEGGYRKGVPVQQIPHEGKVT